MNSRSKRILALCNLTTDVQRESPEEPKTVPAVEASPSEGVVEDRNHDNIQTLFDSDGDFVGSSSDEYVPSAESSASDSHVSDELGGNSHNKDLFETHGSISPTSEKIKDSFAKKRRKNVSKWTKSVRKEKRVKGEEYTGYRNIKHPARPLLPSPCARKQKHTCTAMVEEQHRLAIYTAFRSFASIDEQRQFVLNNLAQNLKKRTTRNIENSRKTYTNHYFFTINGEKKTVCREFFMATLNITDSLVRSCLKKQSGSGMLLKDQRGKHPPHNKLDKDSDDFLRNHINSFPAVESHYCRQSTSKKYLDASLNVTIMHKLYTDACQVENRRPVHLEKYRTVFNEYNLGFYKPKKDQCKKCLFYNSLTDAEKVIHEYDHSMHIEQKNSARQQRNEDKEIAKTNTAVLSFNFDLQAVLNCPKGSTGQIFYLRKLAVYNLTIYNLGHQDVTCYVWDETEGRRGANKISSCIYDFILSQINISSVRMMSDGCGGQQKNSIFAAMCLNAVIKHPTLQTLDHKFFETGHTEMECDSIHSKIEQKAKHVPVYTPEGWTHRDARRNPFPFVVKNMLFDDFYDFKSYYSNASPQQIPWRKVCWLHYEKTAPSKIFYKTNFKQENFIEVDIKQKRGRPKQETIEKAYSGKLPIAELKFQNLMTMCKDLTIPKVYHNFYKSLTANKTVRDNLPAPDADEDSMYE